MNFLGHLCLANGDSGLTLGGLFGEGDTIYVDTDKEGFVFDHKSAPPADADSEVGTRSENGAGSDSGAKPDTPSDNLNGDTAETVDREDIEREEVVDDQEN